MNGISRQLIARLRNHAAPRNHLKKLGDVEIIMEKDDELVDITDTKWYKERKTKRNPGRNLKNNRSIHGYTQAILANKLGIHTHHISEMETGKRAISKAMALKLSEAFDVSPERFI